MLSDGRDEKPAFVFRQSRKGNDLVSGKPVQGRASQKIIEQLPYPPYADSPAVLQDEKRGRCPRASSLDPLLLA